MSTAGLTFIELLDWIGEETRHWAEWTAKQPPEIWKIEVGTGRTATLRDLLFHAYLVDLRYGQRLCGEPVSTYEQEAGALQGDLFQVASRGQGLLRRWVLGTTASDLEAVIEFQTLSAGLLRASQRKVVAHSLTHHLRHTAQAATALRQHGHATDWAHDLMVSGAMG